LTLVTSEEFYATAWKASQLLADSSIDHDNKIMRFDEQASPEQIAALRLMSGSERLRLAEQLYWTARKIKAVGVRSQHPGWSAERVEDEVRRIFTNAST
jgi:hypothetical protein